MDLQECVVTILKTVTEKNTAEQKVHGKCGNISDPGGTHMGFDVRVPLSVSDFMGSGVGVPMDFGMRLPPLPL